MFLEILGSILLGVQSPCVSPLSSEECAYSTVIGALRSWSARGATPGVLLNERVFSPEASDLGKHSAALLKHLREAGMIVGTCAERACTTTPSRITVSLSSLNQLPEGSRVQLEEPVYRPVGAPPVQPADTTRAPTDLYLDVVVTTPCPAPPGSERCRVPDTRAFRYFLRRVPGGDYEVVTRYNTGAI